MNKVKPHHQTYNNLAYFCMAVAFLGAMALHAWMSARDACDARWKNVNLQTDYTTEGCMVEVGPNQWVKEKDVAGKYQVQLPGKNT